MTISFQEKILLYRQDITVTSLFLPVGKHFCDVYYEVEPNVYAQRASPEGVEEYYNDTGETQVIHERIVDTEDHQSSFELWMLRDKSGPEDPIEVGAITITNITPIHTVFLEDFGSIVEGAIPGDSNEAHNVKSERNEWIFERIGDGKEYPNDLVVPEGAYEIFDQGLTFATQGKYEDMIRGFRLTKIFKDPLNIGVVISTDTSFIGEYGIDFSDGTKYQLETDSHSDVADTSYIGLWVHGVSGEWLWVHLNDKYEPLPNDPDLTKYPLIRPDQSSPLEVETLMDYSKITLGSGEKTLDLSQFQGLLGDKIDKIIFEAAGMYQYAYDYIEEDRASGGFI